MRSCAFTHVAHSRRLFESGAFSCTETFSLISARGGGNSVDTAEITFQYYPDFLLGS